MLPISIILTVIGIVLLIISLYNYYNLSKIFNKVKHKNPIRIQFFLILFFLVGYIFYMHNLVANNPFKIQIDFLVSSIFGFGALFVLISILVTRFIVLDLKNEKENANTQAKEIKKDHDELKILHKELNKKNIELENTLEEFYTYRLDLSSKSDAKKFKKENQQLKKKLKKIKD